MKRLLAIAVAGAGCSDPGYTCPQNNAHVMYDGTCYFPPAQIAIDGDLADWDPYLGYLADCPECLPGEIAALYATETTDGEIAIFAQTVGAPLIDNRHSYHLELNPLILPLYAIGFRVTPTGTTALVGYSVAVTGMPVRAAIGSTGIELAIPIRALPFTAGTFAFGQLHKLEFGSWTPDQDTRPDFATVCWDASSQLCQPFY